MSRGHLLKIEVWERPVATLDRGVGEACKSNDFSYTTLTIQLPGTCINSFQVWERWQNFKNFFNNLLWENLNFPCFWQLFSTFLWRCGNAVPTRSGGMGTPFPRVPFGNDPCLCRTACLITKLNLAMWRRNTRLIRLIPSCHSARVWPAEWFSWLV